MRRMLAIILLLTLIAVIPAQAVSGQITVPEAAQSGALKAAKQIHSATINPGKTFSFHAAAPGADSTGASIVATVLYLALRSSQAVSFDELSYNADNTGVLVNADHDFRFTNLAPGPLHIAFKTSGSDLICKITVDEADMAEAAAAKTPGPRRSGSSVSIPLGSDPALANNIALAAGSIYDLTLASGDVFSFNAAIGPTDAKSGYQPACDGRGETTMGGGVNIVASALWLLIQEREDFVIVEKSTYGKHFSQTYVETSADAILTDYASDADFAFRYTGDRSVTFYTLIEEETLTVIIE